MSLPIFEEAIRQAIDGKVVANAVVVASSRDTKLRYEKAFGKLSLEDGSLDVPIDAVFQIFSCTKMITSVAVMQCVERKQITLDEPVSRVLPEWELAKILTGIDQKTNEFIFSNAKTPITLRHLLTHTSGLSYGASTPLMEEWVSRQVPELPKWGNVKRGYFLPLNFEPGTPGKWIYGSGIDWAGQVVERLNGGIRLDDYFQANIFAPLGITTATFNPVYSKVYTARICPRVQRQEDGSLIMDPMETVPPSEPEHDSGGGGLYCTALDYHKILDSIVSNDGTLLNEASIDEMFRPQLPDHEELQETLSQFSYAPVIGKDASGGSRGVRWNHSLAGLAAPDGVPGVAAKGTIWWDGLANTVWFMDRKTGTCAFYGSQMLPPTDVPTHTLFVLLQRELMKHAS